MGWTQKGVSMTAVLIVGTTVAGACVGGVLGLWYGAATDKSDLPILPVFTGPVGALIGGLAGVVVGSAVFA